MGKAKGFAHPGRRNRCAGSGQALVPLAEGVFRNGVQGI